jgi:hypothetical protein
MNQMSEKFEIKGNVGFPNPIESFEVKKTKTWGLDLARAIQSEWYYNAGGGCRFYTQRTEFLERRMYANGLQSMGKYKNSLGTNGDLSYLNLSKKAITLIPKLRDIVVNGMADRGYAIKANATDKISQQDKEAYRKQIEDDRLGKDIAVMAKEKLGVEVTSMPIDKIPETKEEQQLHLLLEYKPSYELSTELAIEAVMNDNDYNNIINRIVLKDLVETGLACVKTRTVPNRGITIEHVYPEYKIQSYTDDPYYRDCVYHGEHKRVAISDVLIENPWLNDAESAELKERLTFSGEQWDNYFGIPTNERIKGYTNVLYFTYKTTRERFNKIKEKATGEKVVSPADPIFDESKIAKTDKYKRVSKVEEILFEGSYVLGADILLDWKVAENMARPKSNKQKVCDQYIMIAPNREKGYVDSLIARMINIDDLIQVCELKAQQMIQRMMPDGYLIDPDALAEFDSGDGNVLKPQGVLDMFFQTGSIIARSYTAGGEYNYAKVPVSELQTAGNLNKLQALRAERDSYRNDQREVIGLNKASDASTPDKDSLVGLQKAAALNSNVATRHILDASKEITRRVGEAVFYRTADVFTYFPELREDLERKIGATAVEDLESMKDFHLRDYAINIDLELDDEEKASLELDMSKAIEKGMLPIQDKYKILAVKNFKQAVAYMTLLIDKHLVKEEERKLREFKAQSDANAESAERAEAARQQTAQMVGQIDMQTQALVNEGLIQKEKVKGIEDRLSLEMKIIGDKEIAQINGGVQLQKLEEAEERKDKRTKLQATQQSELIDQRQNNKSPKDFEEDDIELEDFEMPLPQ